MKLMRTYALKPRLKRLIFKNGQAPLNLEGQACIFFLLKKHTICYLSKFFFNVKQMTHYLLGQITYRYLLGN